MVNPSAADAKVRPLTDDGVMAPRPIVRAGVGEAIDKVAVTPLLAAAVETEVTVPVFVVYPAGLVTLYGVYVKALVTSRLERLTAPVLVLNESTFVPVKYVELSYEIVVPDIFTNPVPFSWA